MDDRKCIRCSGAIDESNQGMPLYASRGPDEDPLVWLHTTCIEEYRETDLRLHSEKLREIAALAELRNRGKPKDE